MEAPAFQRLVRQGVTVQVSEVVRVEEYPAGDIYLVRSPQGDFYVPARGPVIKSIDLEKGAIANPDENRMVGHYWLRAPERAPIGPAGGSEAIRMRVDSKADAHRKTSGARAAKRSERNS